MVKYRISFGVVACIGVIHAIHAADERQIKPQMVISGFERSPGDRFPGYRQDFADYKEALKNKRPLVDIQRRLGNDFYFLKVAIGNQSQVRAGAAYLFNSLVDNPELARKFFELNKEYTLLGALNKIENYSGKDNLYGDFVLVPQRGEKTEAEKLTESALDESLVETIADFERAVTEAEESLKEKSKPEDFSSLMQSTIISSSSSSASSMPSVPSVPIITTSDSPEDIVSKRVKIILSWPVHAKSEKVASLQLLAAYDLKRLNDPTEKSQSTIKFRNSFKIFNALRDLGASIPSVREAKGQKYYSIEKVGPVSGKQLQDYVTSGKGDLLLGLCKGLNNLEKTIKKYEANPAQFSKHREIGLMQRYRATYSICAYLQGKAASDQVKKTLAAHDAWIKRAEGVIASSEQPKITISTETLPTITPEVITMPEVTKSESPIIPAHVGRVEDTGAGVYSYAQPKQSEILKQILQKGREERENKKRLLQEVENARLRTQESEQNNSKGFLSIMFSRVGTFVGGVATAIKATFTGIGNFFKNIFGGFWR